MTSRYRPIRRTAKNEDLFDGNAVSPSFILSVIFVAGVETHSDADG